MYNKHPIRPTMADSKVLVSDEVWAKVLLGCQIGDTLKQHVADLIKAEQADWDVMDPTDHDIDMMYHQTVCRVLGVDYRCGQEHTEITTYVWLHLISMASGEDKFHDYLRNY